MSRGPSPTRIRPNGTEHGIGRQEGAASLPALLARALAHHQKGELPEAERLYRQILAVEPRHADSLHLLGVLAHQVGQYEICVQFITKAIAVDKRQAAYHCNLGNALQALGKMDKAESCYKRALLLQPKLAEARMNLGTVFLAGGALDKAEGEFRRALALNPEMAEIHVNLGTILLNKGKFAEAAASLERALALRPEFAEARYNLGNVFKAEGKLDEAVGCYRRALALKPGLPQVHANLGSVLQIQDKLDEARLCYEEAVLLQPENAEAHYDLGTLCSAQGKLDAAAECYQQALALKPAFPRAHYNLGYTFQAQDKLDEAAACFERALALQPNYAEACYNLGCVLRSLGRVDEALERIRQALAMKPDYPQARFGLAMIQLLMGDFENGWRSYRSRWQSIDHDTPMRAYPQPLWNGKKLSQGRLLLWGEQGIGDEIMFAGLVPDALRTGNSIVLDCEPRLRPLFARSFPEVEVISGYEHDDPGESHAAAHLPIGSLPALFRSSEGAFAARTSPYLKADAAERQRFRSRYADGRLLIGLAWHTKNKNTGRKRSLDLSLLAPLFALPCLRWISLQYGDFDGLEEQAALAHAPLLIDRGVNQFTSMDRFAAQMAAMDLVISIDNSTVHLAGALGVPTWLLLPFAPDWRWRQEGEKSAWYEGLRLFRQPQIGDWSSVVRSVRTALAAYVRTKDLHVIA